MAKAVPIDDFSFYDNQLSQLPAFNDGPNLQDSTLLNDAATKTPQFLALDPCADPNVKSPSNCPTPKSWTPTPAPEEVRPPPTIKTYGGSIQNIPMEYPWNICGGRNPEPRPIATCSSGNPQETVFNKLNGDPSESYQLEHSSICESISSIPPFFFTKQCYLPKKTTSLTEFLQTTHLLIPAVRMMMQNSGAAGNSFMKSQL